MAVASPGSGKLAVDENRHASFLCSRTDRHAEKSARRSGHDQRFRLGEKLQRDAHLSRFVLPRACPARRRGTPAVQRIDQNPANTGRRKNQELTTPHGAESYHRLALNGAALIGLTLREFTAR